MSDTLPLTPGIETLLKQYLLCCSHLEKKEEERMSTEQALTEQLGNRSRGVWEIEAGGKKVRVEVRKQTQIEYDEDTLRKRLEDRYEAILKPDLEKIAPVLDQIEACFDHILGVIGSPSPDKVREAIEEGLVTREEFDGAFRKTTRAKISITEST